MKLKAFAKINLSLHVFNKRSDGYHDLESVMQSVSLYDLITLTPIASGIEVSCNNPEVPLGRDNIVYKAAEEFRKQIVDSRKQKAGIRIEIDKRIPMAAGLAGGSADAAAVLYGMNEMKNASHRESVISSARGGKLKIKNEGLATIGAKVGSDVPFCLTGGTCLVKGRGEIVEKQKDGPKAMFVLVTPNIKVATKWAYDEFDKMKNASHRVLDISSARSEKLKIKNEGNNYLEKVVVKKYPEILRLKERLLSLGCLRAQMSGSGPSVFGQIADQNKAEEMVNKLRLDYPQSFVVETIGKGIEIVEP
jgi:4-diphosphocytidyl-2-C-methyl-D-erythritol kinase